MSRRRCLPARMGLAACLVFLAGCRAAPEVKSPGEEGWITMFNGRDLDGWIPKIAGRDLGDNYRNTFVVEDGVLKVSYGEYDGFNGEFGHLFYKDRFSHYRIRLEYRFTGNQAKGGPEWAFRNSGIMVHCQDPASMGKDQSFPVCIEVQLLGGDGVNARTTGNLCTPGTNVVMSGKLEKQHCISSNSDTCHGDQWVRAEVEVNGSGLIRHIINGKAVMEYEKPQLDESDADARNLIKDGNLLVSEGWISLQAESHPVEFRSIEILPLK